MNCKKNLIYPCTCIKIVSNCVCSLLKILLSLKVINCVKLFIFFFSIWCIEYKCKSRYRTMVLIAAAQSYYMYNIGIWFIYTSLFTISSECTNGLAMSIVKEMLVLENRIAFVRVTFIYMCNYRLAEVNTFCY